MTDAMLFATPPWRIFSVRGIDAVSWLNGIVTADITETQKGKGVFGLLLTKHGKIQGELQMTGADGSVFVAVSGGEFDDIFSALSRYLVMEDAEIEPEPSFSAMVVVGRNDSNWGVPLDWAKEPVTIFIGESSIVEARARELEEANIRRVSIEDPDVRFRLGLPLYGRDYSVEDNPHDASLERRAVNWSKGCYLGQEVVCMQDMRGKAKRRILRLDGSPEMVAGGAAVAGGEKVTLGPDLEEVGVVTSVAKEGLFARVKAPHCDLDCLFVGGRAFRAAPLI